MRVSDFDLADAYNDRNRFETLDEVAEYLGISSSTISNRVGIMRRKREEGDLSVPELIYRINTSDAANDNDSEEDEVVDGNDVPLDEKPQLYMEHWTAEDCIQRLRYLVSTYPDTHWTSRKFDKYSGVSKSTWSRYFGTFLQFERSAGAKINRGAHRMELNVAKHAGADAYRMMNEQKQGYEGKYLRMKGGRFKTVVSISDVHDKQCDPFVERVFLDTIKRIQPDVVLLPGDIWDAMEFGKYTQDPRTWDVMGALEWVHNFLRNIREACPEADIIYLEGNHEFRLLRHLSDATPALKTILADLHGFTVPKLLGLDKYEVNYIAKADLAAFRMTDTKKEIGKNYTLLYDAFLAYHFPDGRNWGYAGINGHHHLHQLWHMFDAIKGPYEWHQLSCAHRRNAEYCVGEKWSNGFNIANIDTLTKAVLFEDVTVKDFALVGGKYYYRTEAETWYKGQEFFSDLAA